MREQNLELVVEVIRSILNAKRGTFEVVNGQVFAAGTEGLTGVEQEGFLLLFVKSVPVDLEVPSSASQVERDQCGTPFA